jgi:hypothetical protein
MRVSIRPGDSGYSLHRHLRSNGKRAIITLNGEHESGAITADSEAGVLVRYKIDDEGEMEFDLDREDYVDEVIHGKVEIEVVDEMVL